MAWSDYVVEDSPKGKKIHLTVNENGEIECPEQHQYACFLCACEAKCPVKAWRELPAIIRFYDKCIEKILKEHGINAEDVK